MQLRRCNPRDPFVFLGCVVGRINSSNVYAPANISFWLWLREPRPNFARRNADQTTWLIGSIDFEAPFFRVCWFPIWNSERVNCLKSAFSARRQYAGEIGERRKGSAPHLPVAFSRFGLRKGWTTSMRSLTSNFLSFLHSFYFFTLHSSFTCRMLVLHALVALATVAAALPRPVQRRASNASAQYLSATKDDWINDTLAAWGSPGLGVAVVQLQPDGSWSREVNGYGVADATGGAIHADTLFEIGSNTVFQS